MSEENIKLLKKAGLKITEPRLTILALMQEHKNEHLTVSQIYNDLTAKGISIGYATVYRQLEKLVKNYSVVKYTIDNTSSACFEYVGEDNHSKQSTYHLKCEHCGKIIHLSCNEIEEFENHISSHHNFKVDPAKTVFYGLCENCAKKY